ncbi:MAG TPA: ABC transporter ATP-binding protein, partial [Thermomicrobiales bacterium]|nr:ABC transporter ATP-binding protein [Thermomicrobiales bacterium]
MTATIAASRLPERHLHVHDLGKRYHDTGSASDWALRNLTLDVPFGSLVALLGANGAGKSTLIHLLSGAIAPTTGFIGELSPDTTLGWCSQRSSIDWYLNVWQNVRMGARLAGHGIAASRVLTERALEIVGLTGKATANVDALSGGQQQRLQIARALVANPDILLLDEPTVGLDVESSERLLADLRRRADDGALVIVSSHDLGLLEAWCDRVLLIAEGRLIAFESHAAFMTRFGGEEVLEIAIGGDLPTAAILRLGQPGSGVRLIEATPLRLGIPRGTPLGRILALLE